MSGLEAGIISIPASDTLAKVAIAFATEWVRKNWGLQSFVATFLHVMRQHKHNFRNCCERIQHMHVIQSARAVLFEEHQKPLLNRQLRVLFTEFQTFIRNMQGLIDEIASHYRVSRKEHKIVDREIESMNNTMALVHGTITDCLVVINGVASQPLPGLVLINNVKFSPRSTVAKLIRKTGGPSPLRTGGDANEAQTSLNSFDYKIAERSRSISNEISSLSKIVVDIASKSDERVQQAVAQCEAKLRSQHKQELYRLSVELSSKESEAQLVNQLMGQEPVAELVQSEVAKAENRHFLVEAQVVNNSPQNGIIVEATRVPENGRNEEMNSLLALLQARPHLHGLLP